MAAQGTRSSWRAIKAAISTKPVAELNALIRDLYELSPANRKFLNARFGARLHELDRYRVSVRAALWPNPVGRRPNPSPSAGRRLIREYELASGDKAGVVDLMLVFVEAGAGFAADIGFGDDAFFNSLSGMLERALEGAKALSPAQRASLGPRLVVLRKVADGIGWGFGDCVAYAVDEFLGERP